MAKLKEKSLTEKIADGVDHLLHPNQVEKETKAADESGVKSEEPNAAAVVSTSNLKKNDSNNEHPKFQKFNKGSN